MLDRTHFDMVRIPEPVMAGRVPGDHLEPAEARLADATDEAVLQETLYRPARSGTMTTDQQARMLAAASGRFQRQSNLVRLWQELLDSGVVSRAEMRPVSVELETRRHVLDLARERIRTIELRRQMEREELVLGRALESGTSRQAMLKFEGSGHFYRRDFELIADQFEQQFHYALPVTARGQTRLHQALGLDHRGKIDVGLNPETPEGIWLRQFLEERQIPYIAFRMAVRGAATAPHIHLGTGSTRLAVIRTHSGGTPAAAPTTLTSFKPSPIEPPQPIKSPVDYSRPVAWVLVPHTPVGLNFSPDNGRPARR
jgi:hypothetical protein